MNTPTPVCPRCGEPYTLELYTTTTGTPTQHYACHNRACGTNQPAVVYCVICSNAYSEPFAYSPTCEQYGHTKGSV